MKKERELCLIEVNIPIYHTLVRCAIGKDQYEIIKLLQKDIDVSLEDSDVEWVALVLYQRWGFYEGTRAKQWYELGVGFLSEYITCGLIAHECFHLVDMISNELGIQDAEAKAYLMEYLVDQINDQWNDYMIKPSR